MVKKVALIGTSCAGKTTTALGLTYALKKKGILAEVLASTDRKHLFSQETMQNSEDAQCNIILNQVQNETFWSVRGDVEVLISDRSCLDYFAYYSYQMQGKDRKDRFLAMRELVRYWVGTYSKLYLLTPLKFVDDGKRPSEDFRDGVHKHLLKLIEYFNLEGRITIVDCPAEERLERIINDLT